MPVYKYLVKDKNGQTLAGSIEGQSETETVAALHKKEFIVLKVEAVKTAAQRNVSGGKVKSEDLVIFSRQLATMIDAGIPVVQALSILSEQVETRAFRDMVEAIARDIRAGTSLSDAIAKYPAVFSELFVNMTKAGEASGMLDEVLDRLASYLEKSLALARKVKSSLVYPAVVVTMAMAITAVLLLKVVPTFKGIFEMLGGQLPLLTRILIGVSDALKQYFILLVIAAAAGGAALKKIVSTDKGRRDLDRLKLRVPILGELFRKVAVAKFSRTFSTLVKSGVNVLSALDIVAKTAGNRIVEETIIDCRTAVRNGEPIAASLTKSSVFPPMVCRMISVGEQTGQLEKMLSKIADFYDEQVDAQVSGLTSMIEPLVIAFLGVVVGGIVIALFLPVFQITQLVAGR